MLVVVLLGLTRPALGQAPPAPQARQANAHWLAAPGAPDDSSAPGHLAARPARLLPGQAIVYDWMNAQEAFPRRETFNYDAAGHLTQRVVSDSITGQIKYRYSTTYNAQGQYTEWLGENYANGVWTASFRRLYAYDPYGNQTTHAYQRWQSSGGWLTTDSTQTSYVYDATGAITELTEQVLDSGVLVNQYQEIRTNAGGQWRTVVIAIWNRTTRQWSPYLRWDTPTWDFSTQPARLTQGILRSWNGTLAGDSTRYAYTYGIAGSYERIRARATGPGGSWQNEDRYTLSEDAVGNFTGYQGDSWNPGQGWMLTYALRMDLTYGPSGEVLRDVQNDFGLITRQFSKSIRRNYSNFLTITTGLPAAEPEASADFHPNPTSGPLALAAPAGATTATLRDAVGRVVLTRTFTPENAKLDLSALPAGIYSVALQTRAGTVVRRVVRQ